MSLLGLVTSIFNNNKIFKKKQILHKLYTPLQHVAAGTGDVHI